MPRCGPIALTYLFATVAAWADSQPGVVGDLLVFYTTGNLNVVRLEDGAPLKVAGRITLASHNALHAQSSCADQIILLLWDEVEVYSLAEPAAPKRVAAFQIGKQRAAASGNPRIERTGAATFLVISPIGAAELTVDPERKLWSMADIAFTADFQRKAQVSTPETESARLELVSDRDSGRPRVMKESARFRYERLWKSRTRPGLMIHTEYLRKVDKASGKTVSQLLLGEEQETID